MAANLGSPMKHEFSGGRGKGPGVYDRNTAEKLGASGTGEIPAKFFDTAIPKGSPASITTPFANVLAEKKNRS